MIKLALTCFVFAFAVFSCPTTCAPEAVSTIQHTNGACDPQCNSASCGFEDECLPLCLQSGCNLSLLGNGRCDGECAGELCAFDRGDCGYCSDGCFAYMLNNDLCEEACFTPTCDFDRGADCTPDRFAQEVYVMEGEQSSNGSIEFPYTSLELAFASIHQSAAIYLLGPRLSIWQTQRIDNPLYIQSLLCADRLTEHCAREFTVIDVIQPATLSIVSSVTFVKVRLTSEAAFCGIKYCPQLMFAEGKWTRVDGRLATEDEVAAGSVCEAFSSTVLFRVSGNLTFTVRNTQTVTIDSVTVQPLALVSIEGGHVLFEEVVIRNFHTQRSGGDSAVILSNTAPIEGSFRFLSGSVDFLNLAVAYSAGLTLAPFLLARYIETVEVRKITFRYNLVVEAYSSSYDQSLSALFYLQDFYRLTIADCDFSNNFVSGGLVVVDSSVVLPGSAQGDAGIFAETHILLSSLNFSWNLGEFCLISVRMEEDRLNIKLSHINFSRNAIQAEHLLSFISVQAVYKESAQSRFDFQDVTITESLAASQLVLISRLANVQVASVLISDSGDFDPDVLPQVYEEFAAATNSTIAPSFPIAPQCVSFISIDACVGVSARNVSFQRNYCNYGTCGLEFRDIADFVMIADLLSEHNNCASQKGMVVHFPLFANVSLTRTIIRENTNFDGNVMAFGPLSHVNLRESVCERNFGVYGTCVFLNLASVATLTSVRFLDNLSMESIGGAVAAWVGNEQPLVLVIKDSMFQGNSARKGGVLAFDVMSATSIQVEVRNSNFLANAADLVGAVLHLTMPGALLEGSTFHNCTFLDNHSAYGVIWTMHVAGTLRISNSVFKRNYGSAAAALVVETQPEALTLVENVLFEENFDGPVILKANSRTNSTLVTRNCTFLNNRMGSVAMEGGFWQDSLSLYRSSTVSQVLLSSGTVAELRSAVFTGSSVLESGGAVHVMSGSAFRCFHCAFTNNSAGYAGAAIFAEQDGSVLIEGSRFTNNTAVTGGAALFLSNSMSVVSAIRSTVVEDNYGGNFGVVFSEAAVFQLENVTIRDNTGEGCPGITQLMGHAVIRSSTFLSMKGSLAAFLSLYASSTASIADSYFSGAFVDSGGAVYLSSLSNVTVTSSVFSSIVCLQGGVFTALSSSTVSLTEVTVNSVKSEASGSLLYLYDSSLFVFKSVFRSFFNTGIYGNQLNEVLISESTFEAGEGDLGGGASFHNCVKVTIQVSSFTRLKGKSGGALYFASSGFAAPGAVLITQSLFAENKAEEGGSIYSVNNHLTVESSAFSHNSAVEGGAISLKCTRPEVCAYYVSASEFLSNSASVRGGAMFWTSCKPSIANTTFQRGIAPYGPDLASSPILLREEQEVPSTRTIAPGQEATVEVAVSLRDHYGQQVSIDSSSTAEIGPSAAGCTVSGETRVTADRGLLVFDRYIVYAKPNSSVELVIETAGISQGQAGDPDPHTPFLHIPLQIRDCQPGEYRRADSCEVCAAGTYSFDPSAPCESCPSNAQCLGNCTVTPNSGHWRASQYSPIVLACPNADACLGGIVEARSLSLTGWCAVGYKGNLCQSCDNGFSRAGKNKCEKCPERSDNIIHLAFVTAGVCILVVIIVWTSLRSAYRSSVTHSILIRIFVNYLQLVLLVSDFKLQWPKEVLQLFYAQEAVGGIVDQVYSVDCFLNSNRNTSEAFFHKTMLMTVLPVPLAGVSVLFWMCVAARKRTWRVMQQECVATVIILYFLVLPSLVKSLFSLFSCSEIEAGEYWLTVDLDIRCWSFVHTFYMLSVGLPGLLVWVLGVPLICLSITRRQRKRLNEVVVRLRYGFLVSGYRLTFYYWEFVILYRKVAIICISVFINTYVSVQALTVQFVLLIALSLQYRVQPFSEPLLNAVELRSIIVADVTIFCGLYYLTSATTEVFSWLLFLLIVTINAVFAVYWLSALLLRVFKSCVGRGALCRRVMNPGAFGDEELEAFITEFSAARTSTSASSLQHFYRRMLGGTRASRRLRDLSSLEV